MLHEFQCSSCATACSNSAVKNVKKERCYTFNLKMMIVIEMLLPSS